MTGAQLTATVVIAAVALLVCAIGLQRFRRTLPRTTDEAISTDEAFARAGFLRYQEPEA